MALYLVAVCSCFCPVSGSSLPDFSIAVQIGGLIEVLGDLGPFKTTSAHRDLLTVQGSLNHGNLAQDLADPREGIVLTDRDLPIDETVALTVHQSQGLPGPLHPDLLPSF